MLRNLMICLPEATSEPHVQSVSSQSWQDGIWKLLCTRETSACTLQDCVGAALMDLSIARLLLLYPQLMEEARRTLEEGGVQAPSVICNVTFDKLYNLAEPI